MRKAAKVFVSKGPGRLPSGNAMNGDELPTERLVGKFTGRCFVEIAVVPSDGGSRIRLR
jgi:hypothetical protein